MSLALRKPHKGVDTSRFILRPLAIGDEALYSDIYCDPETMRYVGPPLSTKEAARSFDVAIGRKHQSSIRTQFFVLSDSTSTLSIGVCGVRFGVPRLDAAEVGIVLTVGARNRGCSRDAFATCLEHVLATSAVKQVWSNYAAQNVAMSHLAQSLGFEVSERASTSDAAKDWCWAFVSRHWLQTFVFSTNRGQCYVQSN